MVLGLSHASGAWQSDHGVLSGEQKEKPLATLKQDLRDLHFNAVGYVPELIGEFPYIHNADRLPGSPGTVSGKGQAVQQGKHLYQDVFDPAFKTRLRRHIQGICEKTAKDSNCIGYWWTDIPVWNLGQQKQKFGKNYVEFIRDLPASAPGRVRYEAWQKEAGVGGDAAFLVLIARELYTTTAAAYRELRRENSSSASGTTPSPERRWKSSPRQANSWMSFLSSRMKRHSRATSWTKSTR